MTTPARQPYIPETPRGNGGGTKATYVIIVSVIISALIMFMAMNAYFSPKLVQKVNYDKDITNIVNDIGTLKTSVTSLLTLQTNINNATTQVSQITDKVNTLTQTVSGLQNTYAGKDDLQRALASVSDIQQQLTALKATVSGLNNGVATSAFTTLQSTVDDLSTRMTAAEATIKKLQTTNPTSTTVANATYTLYPQMFLQSPTPQYPLTFTSTTLAGMPLVINNNGGTSTATWEMTISSNNTVAINAMVLGLDIYVSGSNGAALPSSWATVPSLTSNGGTIIWTYTATSSNSMMFVSGWGWQTATLSIPANSSLNLWITLTITWNT